MSSGRFQTGHPAWNKGRPHSLKTRALMRINRKGKGADLGRLRRDLAPTERATTNDIRWAAGFYEGEGTAGRHATEHVTISQKDPWTLERMRALFGGSIYKLDPKYCCAQWSVTGARARGFLMSIYGLLSPRRQEQARKTLAVGEFAA